MWLKSVTALFIHSGISASLHSCFLGMNKRLLWSTRSFSLLHWPGNYSSFQGPGNYVILLGSQTSMFSSMFPNTEIVTRPVIWSSRLASHQWHSTESYKGWQLSCLTRENLRNAQTRTSIWVDPALYKENWRSETAFKSDKCTPKPMINVKLFGLEDISCQSRVIAYCFVHYRSRRGRAEKRVASCQQQVCF